MATKVKLRVPVCEAVQWFPGVELKDLEDYNGHPYLYFGCENHYLEPGDWIIIGPNNNYVATCSDKDFETTYEKVT